METKPGNFEVIIAVVQAVLFTLMAYLLSGNKYRSLWHSVAITALVLVEFAILITGLGLFFGFRGNNEEYKYDYIVRILYLLAL